MNVHFIGIGGIGVSALARYYLINGHKVSGSDLAASEITKNLENKGAKIIIGKHNPKSIAKNTDLVIYSPAISKNNPELKKAKKLKIKCLSYPEALGELTKQHFTIAICGTHGKSTTAAMIGLLLIKAGLNPTVIVGTKVNEFAPNEGGSNCRAAVSKYLVIEADEHFSSFLNYWPKIIVLTSLEPDHLDYYKNFKNYILSFKKFISHLPKNGVLIVNKDDKNIIKKLKPKIKNQEIKIKNYSLKQKDSKKIKEILKIPGEYNISNALAALNVAKILKIPNEVSLKALSEFRGTWRRFEEKKAKINSCNVNLITDYGHHPTQFKATIKAVREKYPNKKIWCIFQPHQYQRTYYLFNEFVEAISLALNKNYLDKLIITDIYEVAGRESPLIKNKVSSKKLINRVKYFLKNNEVKNKLLYIPSQKNFKIIEKYIKKNIEGEEVIIIMGAGDIYKIFCDLALASF